MKTDLEKFVELYESLGIPVKVNKGYKGYVINLVGSRLHADERESTVSEKFDGYSDFYSNIIFDEEGKFVEQGFWE